MPTRFPFRHFLTLTAFTFATMVHAQYQDPRFNNAPNSSLSSGLSSPTAGSLSSGASNSTTPSGLGAGSIPTMRSATPGSAPSVPSQQSNVPSTALEPLGPNDFQRFVQESTGQPLPLYGIEFFQNVQLALGGANPFAPVQNTPVSADYALGPGDEVLIRSWGSIDMDVRGVIDRNGLFSLPRVGSVQLAGVRAAQAEGVLRAAIGKYYRDFELNVTLGQLRSITVYVVGQARRPGAYNLSSMSTLVSGLFASGGPNANGSMRRVQLKRAGQVVTEFDLYSFLAQGNKTGDAKLVDGDVILIPPSLGHVALTGMVNTPAVYELRNAEESLQSLLGVAGGIPVVADPRRATLERLDPVASQPRKVEAFALDSAGLSKTLKNGDVLNIMGILPEFANAVTLRGNVGQPVRLPWREGMRIRDLIPSKDVLISRESVRRQNEILLQPEERLAARTSAGANAPDREPIGQELNRRDGNPLHAARRDYGLGRNTSPQGYRESKESADTLAGRIGNLMDEVNLDYAVIERVGRLDLSVTLIPFNLGRVLSNTADADNLLLQPGDVVTVFSTNDVRVPAAKRRVFVRIEGEVANPGVYQMAPGETLRQLVQRAGGLTQEAYLFGSGFYRDEVRKSQADNLDRLVRRLDAESSSAASTLAQSQGASADASAATIQAKIQAAQLAQKQAVERLRSIKPEGRIALSLPVSEAVAVEALPALKLQNGDRLNVPSRPDFVYVYGSVNTEAALLHRPGLTVSDYLEQSGLSSGADRDNVILLRADGSALSNSSFWSNNVLNAKVLPGDSLLMPEKLDRESGWSFFIRNTKDITQILYQLGLGAASLKTLRQ